MKTTTFTCIALLILTMPAARSEQFRTDINPALRYYRAFLLTTEPISDADRDYLTSKKGIEQKLPERFGKILASYDYQFALVRSAYNATVPCDWGIDLEHDGPNAFLPHLGRAKGVARVAQLRAVWDLQHGNQTGARDDLYAAFVLGRNASRDNTLIGVLVQFAIESLDYTTIAQNYGEFSPETLKQLVDGFDAAPSRGMVAPCIPREKRFVFDWTLNKLLELQKTYPDDDAKVMAKLHEMLSGLETVVSNFWPQVVAASGGTSEGVVKLLRESDPFYPRAAEIMTLPPAEYETQAKQLLADIRKSKNPFMAALDVNFAGVFGHVRTREFNVEAMQAMVHAAVEYKLHGESGLKSVTDPFGNGPFGFQRFVFKGVDRGFELKSAYAGGDAPFVMIFVEKEGPAFQVTGPDAGKAIDK
jgi:hypothetical protein